MGTLAASRTSIAVHYHERDLGNDLCQFLVGRRGMDMTEAKAIVDPLLIESMKELFTSDVLDPSSTNASGYYQDFSLPEVAGDVEAELEAINVPDAGSWAGVFL